MYHQEIYSETSKDVEWQVREGAIARASEREREREQCVREIERQGQRGLAARNAHTKPDTRNQVTALLLCFVTQRALGP